MRIAGGSGLLRVLFEAGGAKRPPEGKQLGASL
jgi:hypothetical protein